MSSQIKIGDATLTYEIQTDGSANKRFAVITGAAKDAKGDLTIPVEIEGFPVTSIRDKAFLDCIGLTSVVIPDSVTSIGDRAFWGCRRLTSVSLPKHLKGKVPKYAFENCSPDLKIAYRDA